MFTVCFIHAHAKRDRGDNDLAFIVLPLLLNAPFVVRIHPRVEVFSFEAVVMQSLSYFLSSGTGIAIYDSGLVWVIAPDKFEDVVFYVSFLGNNVVA